MITEVLSEDQPCQDGLLNFETGLFLVIIRNTFMRV